MDNYAEMVARHKMEMDALPLGFAFDQEQFRAMMESWGLDSNQDLTKIYRLPEIGAYIQKKDAGTLQETIQRHLNERKQAVAADSTGTGFIYQMFLMELADHEYGYTGDPTDALDSIGITMDEVQSDPRLQAGYQKAVKQISERME